MSRLAECRHEADVVAAVTAGRWPEAVDASLRDHVTTCRVCADVRDVAAAMAAVERETLADTRLPAAGQVWWRAQVRARQDAARAAARPVLVAQALGAACALGLLAALITWQWPSLSAAADAWLREPLAAVELGVAGWLALGASAVLGPLAIYYAVVGD
jgi:hypothetical protein